MTADTYEWFPPANRIPASRRRNATKAARIELERYSSRDRILPPELSRGPCWLILLTIFDSDPTVLSPTALVSATGIALPELSRWLLSMQALHLVSVNVAMAEVRLLPAVERQLVEYFSAPLFVAPARRCVAERLRLASPLAAQHLRDGLAAVVSAVFISYVSLPPILAILRP